MKTFILLALAACQFPAPAAPLEPVDARDSTFRVDRQAFDVDLDEWVDAGSGTAWVARDREYLVTAGHVCAGAGVSFTLVSASGIRTPARVVKTHPVYDLCLLVADSPVGPALEVAPADPLYDEDVMAVGAPLGVFGCDGGSSLDECGMAPISRGRYAGGNLVSMPMAGGNSGSAVFTSRGVIGVLVEGYRGFDSLSFIEPRSHLVNFLL